MYMTYIYKIYTATFLTLVLLLSGCSAGPSQVGQQLGLEMPKVTGIGYSLVSATPNLFEADITLTVHNPNSITVGLNGLNCEAFVNGVKAADITLTEPAVLEAQQDTMLKLRVAVQGSQVWPCLSGHISRGESSTLSLSGTAYIGYGWLAFPYAFTYDRKVKTDLLNYKKLDGEKPLPLKGLAVTGLSSRWGVVGPGSLQVVQDVSVKNSGKDTAILSTSGYEVRGNGISLAGGTVGNGGASIAPGENTVMVVHTMKSQNIAPWLASHLNNTEVTTLELSFNPGSCVETPKDKQSLDGRSFKEDIHTNLAKEIASLRSN